MVAGHVRYEFNEIAVLGEDNCGRDACLRKNLWIFCVAQSQVADCKRVSLAFVAEPLCESG